jgi:hypothetical protein
MEAIKKGSIEALIVPLRDRLGNVVNLTSVSNLKFSTTLKDDDTAVQTDAGVALDGDNPMYALCEIDTTLAAYVEDEEYKLYIKYTDGTEAPVLGPVFFRVVSD